MSAIKFKRIQLGVHQNISVIKNIIKLLETMLRDMFLITCLQKYCILLILVKFHSYQVSFIRLMLLWEMFQIVNQKWWTKHHIWHWRIHLHNIPSTPSRKQKTSFTTFYTSQRMLVYRAIYLLCTRGFSRSGIMNIQHISVISWLFKWIVITRITCSAKWDKFSRRYYDVALLKMKHCIMQNYDFYVCSFF